MAEVGSNQSVERSIMVLRAFTAGRSDLRVADVAKLTGLGASNASRLLGTLESCGFVQRDPFTGLYHLGLEVVSLAGTVLNAHPVHRQSRQIAQTVAATTGLGANVAIRDADHLFYLLNFEGSRAPRSFVLTGQRNPLHATGLGKSLLTALTANERRTLLPIERLIAYTPNTITDHRTLDAEIATVTARGYAVEVEELALSRACVAAPIRDARGEVIAALSVSGPLSAIDLGNREDELSGVVIEAADSISTGLGYSGPAHQAARLPEHPDVP